MFGPRQRHGAVNRRDQVRPDQVGQADLDDGEAASVTAMAGRVRRISTPAVSPSAKANAA